MLGLTATLFSAPACAGVQAISCVGCAIAVAVTIACSICLGDNRVVQALPSLDNCTGTARSCHTVKRSSTILMRQPTAFHLDAQRAYSRSWAISIAARLLMHVWFCCAQPGSPPETSGHSV